MYRNTYWRGGVPECQKPEKIVIPENSSAGNGDGDGSGGASGAIRGRIKMTPLEETAEVSVAVFAFFPQATQANQGNKSVDELLNGRNHTRDSGSSVRRKPNRRK